MKAAVLTAIPTLTLAIEELEEPVLDSESVLLSVEACGICGTDLHIMDGASYKPQLPFVLGHESVGKVVAVGADVDQDWLGRRVTATQFVGCGRCSMCRVGDVRLCELGALVCGVLGLPGGFAESLLLRKEQLVALPDELDAVSAATLVDAGTTAHNVARVLRKTMAPGDGSHLVVGAGPVGMIVAEILRSEDYDILIAETNPVRKAAISHLGHRTIESIDDLTEQFASVIDCAAAPDAVKGELALLRPHGFYFAVGYSVVPEFDLAAIARRELTIRGIRSGTKADLAAVLNLAAQGKIRLPRQDTWRLEEINQALQHLRSGDLPGKAIIVNGGSA